MLIESTFIHIDKFGFKTEKELWNKNIFTWYDYQNIVEKENLFFDDSKSKFAESINALRDMDINYFAKKLKKSEYFRLALSFPEEVMFLDIETTGLSRYYDHITMIGWSFCNKYDYYVHGIDKEKKFIDAIQKAKIIVTFNGSIFDIPFIKSVFSNIITPLAHIDLRFLSKSVGLSGGQKKIEDEIGFKRSKSLKNTDGYMATVLWDEYKWGKKLSLEKLIAYNHSDVEGMKYILDYCVNNIYKNKNYKKYFDKPFKFTSFKSKLDKKEIKQFVQNNAIPFDPQSTLQYKELTKKINKSIKIVGIDLTGSEQKPTGVAFLKDNYVDTLQINSDDDMVASVVKFKPDLVSIDSPLSLPLGRISVFDDDPGRDKYGILRVCERTLKKRGVNAYPTLLPSMQKLTKRGIELADRFRKLGIPVIESYPGVVQDIIGLPRKQASLRLLKKGLGKFGLKGRFLKEEVSHDEIDAITSAIVGIFLLSGDYEAIGDLNENLMIIPDLNAKRVKKNVIGLSGKIASGKTTAAKYIETYGFKYTRYSQVLESMLKQDNKDVNRENLQDLGSKMNINQIEFSKRVYEIISSYDNIVIDGLRHPEDYTFFFEIYGFNFKLLYIEAFEKEKEQRYIADGKTSKEYKNAIINSAEYEIPKLKNFSDKVIENNKSIEEFKEKLTNILQEME